MCQVMVYDIMSDYYVRQVVTDVMAVVHVMDVMYVMHIIDSEFDGRDGLVGRETGNG